MYCSQCGSKNEETSNICLVCGDLMKQGQEGVLDQGKVLTQKQGTVYVVLGWLFFALSLLLIPLLFGAGAFIMGFMTYRVRSHVHGVILMVFSVVGAIIGTIIGFIVGMMNFT